MEVRETKEQGVARGLRPLVDKFRSSGAQFLSVGTETAGWKFGAVGLDPRVFFV